MLDRAPAFLAATAEEKAGFVAHLFLLAADDTPVQPALMQWLILFTELAGLADDLDAGARQARVDAFYVRWPLSPALLSLLEAETTTLEARAARASERAAEEIGAKRQTTPVMRRSIAGTFGGGNLALLAVRTGAAVTAPPRKIETTTGQGLGPKSR